MKLFSNETIEQGQYPPESLIWRGKVIQYPSNRHIGKILLIRLPWWVRKPNFYTRKREDITWQLAFQISNFEGPEEYCFFWLPCESLL